MGKAQRDKGALIATAAELEAADLHPRCIVERHTYADVAVVAAPGGVGKSTLMLYEAAHVALTRPQIREAMTQGAIPVELARSSVLLAYRSPLGAVGLLAIPRDRYDGLAMLTALEALHWAH